MKEMSPLQPSQAAPQCPEGTQGDGVQPQHSKVAPEEQLIKAVEESQPLSLLLVHLVLTPKGVVDELEL